jgi:uncharacterized protein involved in exopolysaccharide biosynthesis
MDELNLREVIETVIKGKWIISIITVVCMVLSIMISSFFLKPVYEAQTMLMISPILNAELQNKDNNTFSHLVGTLSQYPQMTIDTYREQVKAPYILQYIREQKFGEGKSLKSIADMISVNAIKNTNLINISVKSNSAEEASTIANLVSKKFTEFVSETNKKQAENSAQFIKEQMEKEEKNLKESSENLKDFLSKPRGPEELKLELESKLEQLTEFKTKITQMKIDEEATSASLLHGKELLKNTPVKLVTNKSIISDELLSDIIKEDTNLNTKALANIKLSDEQINNIYTTLSNNVNALEIQFATLTSQRKNMEQQIETRQLEIEVLQAELAQKQQEFDIINHEVELIKQTYDAYQQKYKESMIKQSAEIGKSSIVVVSEAIPPLLPIGPRKLFNLALSLAIGLAIGFVVVFLKEYFSSSSIKDGETLSV